MENSVLEKIGNSQLFFILKYIVDNHPYNKFSFDDIQDDEFKENCDLSCKLVGIGKIYYIDYNFILATLIINKNYDFTTSRPIGVIEKPKPKLYSFEIDEFRVEYVKRTYENEMTSYLGELIEPTYNSMINDGTFDYYDGREINTDYYNGETTDVNFDKKSITKIK
jgi:hypothetical protein